MVADEMRLRQEGVVPLRTDKLASLHARRGHARRSGRVARCCSLAIAALAAINAHAEFTSTPVTSAAVGQPYVYDVVATGAGSVEITAPNGLPPWLTLTPTGNGTATLSGTPRVGDTGDSITLRSQDNSCRILPITCYQFQVFDITIVANGPPVIVAPGIADQTAQESRAFSLDVTTAFSDPDQDALTLTASGLPSSLSITGGIISGTPTSDDAAGSPFEVTVTADDGKGGRVSDSFALAVTALARADISLESITATPDPALRGDAIEWVFTVANAGPSTSGAVALVIELAGDPVTLADSACTLTVADARQRFDCALEPIASGETGTVTIGGSAAQAGDVFVTATVSASDAEPVDPDAANNSGAMSVNVGQAVSAAAAQVLTGGAATAAAAGDLDGDGFDDVAVATGADEPTAVHLNLENPTQLDPALMESGDSRRGLSAVPMSLDDAAASTGVALADFDADGDLDLVVANAAGAASAWFLNNGDGSLTASGSLGEDTADARAVAAGDLDGDGFADLVFAEASASVVYLNQGGTGFAAGPPLSSDGPLSGRDIAVADLVGDGLPDLIVANGDGPADLYQNLGGGSFDEPIGVATGPTSSVAVGDFNGDGFQDLVFGREIVDASTLPSNLVYVNNGTGGFVMAGELGASPTVDVLTGDLNADSALDVVSINATGTHQVFVGDGDGNFSLHPQLFVSRDAAGAAIAHIGRLQSADVVVAGADGLDVFFNDGRGNLGLGDTDRPVIELIGEKELTLEVEDAYKDQGATATDDTDGELTPSVDDPVDTKVIGTYTVTYTAMDSAGNAAVPVTRTVHVEARAGGGGGGGAAGISLIGLLLLGLLATRNTRRRYADLRG